MSKSIGHQIYSLAELLWPINRSLTGDGNRETLNLIKKKLPNLKIYEVPSGTKIYDWVIPDECHSVMSSLTIVNCASGCNARIACSIPIFIF